MAKAYLFRVVVPKRDYWRVEWLSNLFERGEAEFLRADVSCLFWERGDLDAVELVFVVRDSAGRREVGRKLAESLKGSIGFFTSHAYREG